MQALQSFNFRQWIDEHRHLLKPPVGNKVVFEHSDFIIMAVGGPNSRKDFHDDPGDEFFYQLEGDMLLKTIQDGRMVDITIREGDFFLLPGHVHHSPQRFPNTVGLVIERQRRPGERDGLLWYCESCHRPLYAEYFELTNIETQFAPVFERFFSSLEHRTCRHCGAVLEPPAKAEGSGRAIQQSARDCKT